MKRIGRQMTPAQMRRALERANLSQIKAARVLDINERTMRSYVSGQLKIPRAITLAMAFVVARRGAVRRWLESRP